MIDPSALQISTPISPMREFRSPKSYASELCKWPLLLVAFFSLTASAYVASAAADESSEAFKMFQVCEQTRWGQRCHSKPSHALVVGNVMLLGVAMMTGGYQGHFVLLGCTIMFGALGIITVEDALAGFSSSGNIASQALLLLVSGIQDAGILDRIFHNLLGTVQTHRSALVRALVLAALMSSLLQQTTTVMAAAPALVRWANLAGIDAKELLLPFACVAGMGANFLLAANTVALTIDQMMPEAHLGMLDIALPCCIMTCVTSVYCLCCARLLRGSSEDESLDRPRSPSEDDVAVNNCFVIDFTVSPESFLIGQYPKQAGLLAMTEVSLIPDAGQLSRHIITGDKLRFAATAVGVAVLRSQNPGLTLANLNPLETLGARRHRRRLFEAAISRSSPLVGCQLPLNLAQADCLSARRPETFGEIRRLCDGDILLLEAFDDFPDLRATKRNFNFVSTVPGSAPPRHGRRVDAQRGWLAVCLLIAVPLLAALRLAELVFIALGTVGLCLVLNVIHREAVLHRLNIPVYLAIAGGLGVSKAMAKSGLANALAGGVIALGHYSTGGSTKGILISLSWITSFLANMMSNTATAAIVAPIASRICQTEELEPKPVAVLLILSANAAFATPFATTANLLVKSYGSYEFLDYVRFGLPLQLLLLLVTPLMLQSI